MIYHLHFADDSLLFMIASSNKGGALKNLLQEYAAESGQLINYEKSAVVFSKSNPLNVKREVLQVLEVPEAPHHDNYLGLPTF